MKQGESLESIVVGYAKLLMYCKSFFKLCPALLVTLAVIIHEAKVMMHIRFKFETVGKFKSLFGYGDSF